MTGRAIRRTVVTVGLLLALSACTRVDVPGPAATPDPAISEIAPSTPSTGVIPSDATPVPTRASAPAAPGGDDPVTRRLWWAWGPLGLLLGLVVGLGVGRGRRRSDDAEQPMPDAPTPDAAPDAPPSTDPRLLGDLVLAHDLASDEASTGHLEEVLVRAGAVRQDAEPGTPFDGDHHRAVGTDPSPAPGSVPVVVRVVRPGWRTDATVLRRPEVVVARPVPRHPPPT